MRGFLTFLWNLTHVIGERGIYYRVPTLGVFLQMTHKCSQSLVPSTTLSHLYIPETGVPRTTDGVTKKFLTRDLVVVGVLDP